MMVKDYHSVYDLNYHLILVTKYRRQVINDDISTELYLMFDSIGEKYGIKATEFLTTTQTISMCYSLQSPSLHCPSSLTHTSLLLLVSLRRTFLKFVNSYGKKSSGAIVTT